MEFELLSSSKNAGGISFDPRSKLAVLIVLAIIVLGGNFQTDFHYLPAILPLVMMLGSRKYRMSALYITVFVICLFTQKYALPHISGTLSYLLMMFVVMPLYFMPTVAAAGYVVSTTTVSEFISSMERLHVPRQFTISAAVMFRFFPTVMEEWRSISDAMKLRGIHFSGSKPGAVLEYKLVPMLMCSIKIGEELSAAALTRGFDGPVKRTNICETRIKLQDVLLLIVCTIILAFQIYFWIRG